MIIELSERSKQIFRQIVDAYVETGEPIGSRTIARRPDQHLSPASIRNVMADLEDAGLLYAPHTSAGRVPTDLGFRLYVDGLLESGHLNEEDRALIDSHGAGTGRSLETILGDASSALSGLSRYRRPGAVAQGRASVQAGRVRPAQPRPRPGRDGRRQRHGREPLHRRAGRHRRLGPGRGRQLPDRAPGRPLARRARASRSNARSANARASSTP